VDIVRAQFSDEDAELIKRGPKNQIEKEKLEHFKNYKYRDLRSKLLKALVLAIIYGQTPKSVAKKTKQKISFINAIFEQLEITYPDLFRFINANVKYGSQRGYIELRGGFRIHVSGADNEINRHRNNPIQGMCAVLFNRALLYAYEAIPRFGARILFPLYDAIVVEAPLSQFENCQRTCAGFLLMCFKVHFQRPRQ
jgi:DNA polymerase I-like protein with 3'-5' exonuclease and polymerase domains